MKAAKVQSPGRRGLRKTLAPRGTIDSAEKVDRLFNIMEAQHPLTGEIPDRIRNDPRFRLLFQQWKMAGGKKDSPYVSLMRNRWAFLTQESTHATGSDPVNPVQ